MDRQKSKREVSSLWVKGFELIGEVSSAGDIQRNFISCPLASLLSPGEATLWGEFTMKST